jgi:D-alanine-D-alanine ligase-like ATP-grasp enzyme
LLIKIGYRDSCADIAYALRSLSDPNISVITPTPRPDPAKDADWSFPDTEPGILAALALGANTLWANTSLFSTHPIAASPIPDTIKIVGQPPALADVLDDKAFTNSLLRKTGRFTLPKTWILDGDILESVMNTTEVLMDLPYPVIVKPARGRGSQGVKLCLNLVAALDAVDELVAGHGGVVVIEEFLEGEEGTVTVLPPINNGGKYTALPFVTRFEQIAGVAPWNGDVPVTANSRVLTQEEESMDEWYAIVKRECEDVANELGFTGVCRIDVRRPVEDERGRFVLFDVNLKPVGCPIETFRKLRN